MDQIVPKINSIFNLSVTQHKNVSVSWVSVVSCTEINAQSELLEVFWSVPGGMRRSFGGEGKYGRRE